MKRILNYSTTVGVEKTLSEIQQILVAHGARSVLIDYGADALPTTLSFKVSTQRGDLPFRLPANVEAVRDIMAEQRLPGYKKRGQAARVAWRIIKDWVEAQMAIIEAGMVDLQEVFLPYLLQGEETLYKVIQQKGYLLPEGRD